MKIAKNLVFAFLIGGALGALSQVFFKLALNLLGPSSPFICLFTLACMGLFGGLMYLVGFYQKLEQWGQFGAFLNFSGLASSVAMTVEAAKVEGDSTVKAIGKGLKLVLGVAGSGAIAAIIVATIDRILFSL